MILLLRFRYRNPDKALLTLINGPIGKEKYTINMRYRTTKLRFVAYIFLLFSAGFLLLFLRTYIDMYYYQFPANRQKRGRTIAPFVLSFYQDSVKSPFLQHSSDDNNTQSIHVTDTEQ